MGKLFTPQSILSGFQTTNSLNTNFENIEEALDACLSRTGESPNQMQVDLDMDSNDVLNVGLLQAERIESVYDTPTNLLVSTDQIEDGAVTEDKLAADSVTESKIENGAVTSAKVDDTVVTQTSSTGAAYLSTGNTSERPASPVEGMLRRNSQTGEWEGFNGASWEDIGSGGGGGTVDNEPALLSDLDSPPASGPFYTDATTSNRIVTVDHGTVDVTLTHYEIDSDSAGQVATSYDENLLFHRSKISGVWQDWVEVGTADPVVAEKVQLSENAHFATDGTDISMFEGDVSGLSVSGGEILVNGTDTSVTVPMLSIGNEACVYYGSFRITDPDELMTFRFTHSNSAEVALFFNHNLSMGSRQSGTISMRSTLSGGSPEDSQILVLGEDFTQDYKFVLEWAAPDSINKYTSLYSDNGTDLELLGSVRSPGGTSAGGAPVTEFRVATDPAFFSGGAIQYLQASRPNFASIGDSICAGHNNYDPLPSYYGGTDDYSSSWQCHLRSGIKAAFPALRNNFVSNYGVGGETSTEILARADEIVKDSPTVAILGGPNNDSGSSIAYGERNDNISRLMERLKGVGAYTVNLGAIVPNSASGGYPLNAEYYHNWNKNFSDKTTADQFIDIMEAAGLKASGEEYIDSSIATDGIHPSAAGYEIIGDYISSQLTPMLELSS